MTALTSPAAERNRGPIGEVLRSYFKTPDDLQPGQHLRVLEIASGYGSHAMYFASLFPHVIWQPTEFDSGCLSSIVAHLSIKSDSGNPQTNVRHPVKLDVSESPRFWPSEIAQFAGKFDFIFNANMIHISPWKCTLGLFAGASNVLKVGGKLLMYGPFAFDGVLEPQSNVDFDHSLKLNHEEWGIRDVRDLEVVAAKENFILHETHDMPSNNKILVWQKV